jgi:hypothetical protein
MTLIWWTGAARRAWTISRARWIDSQTTDRESDVGSRQTAGQRPRPKSLPIYISWYINGYGGPWTSSDVNPRIAPSMDKLQVLAGAACDYGAEGLPTHMWGTARQPGTAPPGAGSNECSSLAGW